MAKRKVTYRLGQYRPNFNFLEFLVSASSRGATHIFIHEGGKRNFYGPAETERRIKSIIEPACALAGCSFSYADGDDPDNGYHISSVISAHREVGLKKLQTVLPAGKERYTVTLRKSDIDAHRNSNEDAWREFAEKIGAYVIEDYADKPIHLHERMALYAGAQMNYFVANGPINLCLFSDYPYVVFMKGVNETYHRRHGWWRNQLPWAHKQQISVWDSDEPGHLIKYTPEKLGLLEKAA